MAGTRGKKSARWQNPQSDQLLEAAETTSVPDTWTQNTAIDTSPTEVSRVVPVAATKDDAVNLSNDRERLS
jgi:hypothetical protein